MKQKRKQGFTLLEIIIVIIIVGVLASLALPRFFSMVEYSKATEALNAFSAIRGSLERCYLNNSGTYTGCLMAGLDIDNPGQSPNAHFTYGISGQNATGYSLLATRNTRDNGSAADTIGLTQDATSVTKSGGGNFIGIK